MMDAAFVISIKTRHDRTERQSPDQHAANRDASWFFCSVMVFGLSNSRVKMVDWIRPVNINTSMCQPNRSAQPPNPPPRYSTLHLRASCDRRAVQAS